MPSAEKCFSRDHKFTSKVFLQATWLGHFFTYKTIALKVGIDQEYTKLSINFVIFFRLEIFPFLPASFSWFPLNVGIIGKDGASVWDKPNQGVEKGVQLNVNSTILTISTHILHFTSPFWANSTTHFDPNLHLQVQNSSFYNFLKHIFYILQDYIWLILHSANELYPIFPLMISFTLHFHPHVYAMIFWYI